MKLHYHPVSTTSRPIMMFAADHRLELDYRLVRRGPFARLTDLLFIRSQMRGSMQRSLARLKLEVEEVAAGEPPQPRSL